MYALLILLTIFCSYKGSSQTDFCGSQNTSFNKGEHLFFKVFYNMGRIYIGAGEATFDVNEEMFNNRKVYHIMGNGRTVKSYEWFYKVRDLYETYIDEQTMLPLKFVRNVNEGGFKIYNNISFNQSIGQAVSSNGIFNVPHCIQDVLSAIYYARNIDYSKIKPGTKIPFTMFLDDKVYNLFIRYWGKEQITTRYGTFNALKITPLLIEGTMFKGGEKMTVWVSDDANHLPLRIDSPILVGSIKVDLVSFNNIRNPLTALVSKN